MRVVNVVGGPSAGERFGDRRERVFGDVASRSRSPRRLWAEPEASVLDALRFRPATTEPVPGDDDDAVRSDPCPPAAPRMSRSRSGTGPSARSPPGSRRAAVRRRGSPRPRVRRPPPRWHLVVHLRGVQRLGDARSERARSRRDPDAVPIRGIVVDAQPEDRPRGVGEDGVGVGAVALDAQNDAHGFHDTPPGRRLLAGARPPSTPGRGC